MLALDFIDKKTSWGKKRSVNTQMRRRAGFYTKDDYGNVIEMGYKSEIIGVTPVSYTHLDVYKRQLQQRIIDQMIYSTKQSLQNIMRNVLQLNLYVIEE